MPWCFASQKLIHSRLIVRRTHCGKTSRGESACWYHSFEWAGLHIDLDADARRRCRASLRLPTLFYWATNNNIFSHTKSVPATVSRTEWMHPYFFEGKRCNLWSHADQRSLRLATHSNYLTVTRSNSREDVNIYQIISREESPPPKFSAVSQHLKPQPVINWISRWFTTDKIQAAL